MDRQRIVPVRARARTRRSWVGSGAALLVRAGAPVPQCHRSPHSLEQRNSPPGQQATAARHPPAPAQVLRRDERRYGRP
eukprot:scaffold3886_cov399-Prasinococcus_capsulatus_cf.AAC.9